MKSIFRKSIESSRFSRASEPVDILKKQPDIEFQFVEGDYDEIDHQLGRDKMQSGYVKDKDCECAPNIVGMAARQDSVRYDYNGDTHRRVVSMPTGVYELFINRVEDAIQS